MSGVRLLKRLILGVLGAWGASSEPLRRLASGVAGMERRVVSAARLNPGTSNSQLRTDADKGNPTV